MTEAQAIAENQVKSATSGEMVTMKSLWENQDCVPKLDEHNVRLVGIGVEELGVKEFLDGKFFAGDLFIDVEKKCYKDLQYKRYGILNLIPALFSKTSRDAIAASRTAQVGGDLKGDYYQVGGTLVVKKGGEKVLLNHKQDSLADHVDNKEVLKSLNIS
ncbi:Prostamide/prostaglandin F synthase like protein [Argiope bruennichi]|uniref:Prostamide/prostaglandin F synthase like protein n=1 Tax=Argiope bruennichi TaxID=94029 RepID=A0A8T0FQS8_ARGBR|nr:Prostamide/prostaglandin F synthase like protein [Argiope bruennichi]